jgi:hypothetical protein
MECLGGIGTFVLSGGEMVGRICPTVIGDGASRGRKGVEQDEQCGVGG